MKLNGIRLGLTIMSLFASSLFAPYSFLSSLTQDHQAYIHDEQLINTITESFQYNPEYENMIGSNSIWKELFTSKKATDLQKVTTLKHLYSLCQLEASCYNNYQRTCKLLAKEPAFLTQLSYGDDLELFFMNGPVNDLNTRMACPLGREVLGGLARFVYSHMQEGDAKTAYYTQYHEYFDLNKPEDSRLHMRFAHAESLMPLYELFIMKPPKRPNSRLNFSGATHIPSSANFQFDL